MSTETPNTTDDEGVKDGIHYGVGEDGNEFFTAADQNRTEQRNERKRLLMRAELKLYPKKIKLRILQQSLSGRKG